MNLYDVLLTDGRGQTRTTVLGADNEQAAVRRATARGYGYSPSPGPVPGRSKMLRRRP